MPIIRVSLGLADGLSAPVAATMRETVQYDATCESSTSKLARRGCLPKDTERRPDECRQWRGGEELLQANDLVSQN